MARRISPQPRATTPHRRSVVKTHCVSHACWNRHALSPTACAWRNWRPLCGTRAGRCARDRRRRLPGPQAGQALARSRASAYGCWCAARCATYADDVGVQMVIGDLGDPRIVDHAVAGAAYGLPRRRGDARQSARFRGRHRLGHAQRGRCLPARVRRRLVYVSSMSVFDHAGRDPGSAHERKFRVRTPSAMARRLHPDQADRRRLRTRCDRDRRPARGDPASRPDLRTRCRACDAQRGDRAGRTLGRGRAAARRPFHWYTPTTWSMRWSWLRRHRPRPAASSTWSIRNVITQQAYLARCQRKLGDELQDRARTGMGIHGPGVRRGNAGQGAEARCSANPIPGALPAATGQLRYQRGKARCLGWTPARRRRRADWMRLSAERLNRTCVCAGMTRHAASIGVDCRFHCVRIRRMAGRSTR